MPLRAALRYCGSVTIMPMTDERLAEIELAQSYGLSAEQQGELIDEVTRLRAVVSPEHVDELATAAKALTDAALTADAFRALARAVQA